MRITESMSTSEANSTKSMSQEEKTSKKRKLVRYDLVLTEQEELLLSGDKMLEQKLYLSGKEMQVELREYPCLEIEKR
jgi:hypothetical protein